MVKIHPSLMFSGTCGDAFRRYASLFGGDIVLLLTYAESPLAQHVPPEWRDKVWFARLRAGGLEVTEPAADLAIVAALVSSARGEPLPESSVFFGEIGLLGEVRRVPAAPARVREAAALGFERVYLPVGNSLETSSAARIEIRPVERVADLVRAFATGSAKASARTSSRIGAGPMESDG